MVTEFQVAIAKAQQGHLSAGLKPGSRYFFSLSGVGRGGPRGAHSCFVLNISGVKNWGGLGLRITGLVGAGWAEVVGFCWGLGEVGWRSILGRGVAIQLVLFQF